MLISQILDSFIAGYLITNCNKHPHIHCYDYYHYQFGTIHSSQ